MADNTAQEVTSPKDKLTKIRKIFEHRSVESYAFPIVLFVVQVVILVLFFVFVDYGTPYNNSASTFNNITASGDPQASVPYYYKNYSDIAVMMLIGFGFLMTFLKRYAYGSVALTFLLTCICIEWTVLNTGLWNCVYSGFTQKIHLDLYMLIQGLFGSATILISFGAVIGKVTPSQLLIMTIIEVFLYCLNCYIGYSVLKTADIGGSMFIHTFGAYFGLFCSAIVSPAKAKHGHPNKITGYYSDVFSMIGTVFLWIYWPSFNSAPASSLNQARVIANTVASLIGSCVATFFVSRIVRHGGRFEMEDIQNATLAGGVAIGANADIYIGPGGAICIGLIAGLIGTLGFRFLTPKLEQWIKLNDSCGINNLHGMPGVFGGIVSIICSGIYWSYQPDIFLRGAWQPLFQFATLGHTLGIAILGGLGTGLLLRWLLPSKNFYSDDEFWHLPSDYDMLVPEEEEEAKKFDAEVAEVELVYKNQNMNDNVVEPSSDILTSKLEQEANVV
jgi:ammonium transporter Rh